MVLFMLLSSGLLCYNFFMKMYCHNCGRELEDGETLFSDGCAYCINYYNPDEKNLDKWGSSGEADGGMIGSAIGLLVIAGFLYLLYKFFF